MHVKKVRTPPHCSREGGNTGERRGDPSVSRRDPLPRHAAVPSRTGFFLRPITPHQPIPHHIKPPLPWDGGREGMGLLYHTPPLGSCHSPGRCQSENGKVAGVPVQPRLLPPRSCPGIMSDPILHTPKSELAGGTNSRGGRVVICPPPLILASEESYRPASTSLIAFLRYFFFPGSLLTSCPP